MKTPAHTLVRLNVRRVVKRPSIVYVPAIKSLVVTVVPGEINDVIFKHIDITPQEVINNVADSLVLNAIGTCIQAITSHI
jgi:hypothetical protein